MQRLADVLLDEQHGHPGRQQSGKRAVDAADDYQGQPERQLVEQQHTGVGHQRAADRHRLLLPAGKLRGALRPALTHPAEKLVHALQGPRSRAGVGASHQEVLLDGERLEEPPPFRHHRDPDGHPALRPLTGHVARRRA